MTDHVPDQREHWARTFGARADVRPGSVRTVEAAAHGPLPLPAVGCLPGRGPERDRRAALAAFLAAEAHDALEFGSGQGRDTLLFAAAWAAITVMTGSRRAGSSSLSSIGRSSTG